MIKGYLLDTNICVYAMNAQHKDPLRRTTQEAAVWLRFVDEPAPLYTSEVSLGELVFGAERSTSRDKNLARVEAFLKLVPPLAIARDTWQMFGTTKAALTCAG